MNKFLGILGITAIIFGTTGCDVKEEFGFNFKTNMTTNFEDIENFENFVTEKDDSGNNYTGYSLLVEDIRGENSDIVVGDMTIESDDSYSSIDVYTNNDSIEVVIDNKNMTVEVLGTSDYAENEIDITITGNISKIKYKDTMLDVDMTIKTEADVNINTLGNISGDIDVTGRNVFIAVNGAGVYNINGTANLTNILLNGAGKIEANDFIVSKAVVELNGAGLCEINTGDELEATINGVGQIKYSGNPEIVNKSVSGIGRVTAEN